MNFLLIQKAHLPLVMCLKLRMCLKLLLPASLSPSLCPSSAGCAHPLPQNFNREATRVINSFRSHLSQNQISFHYRFPAEAIKRELAGALTWQAGLKRL